MSTSILQRISSFAFWGASLGSIALCVGCGGSNSESGLELTDVTGTVTIDGQPLQYGEVYFRGAKSPANELVVAEATLPIREGKFESNRAAKPGVGGNSVTVIAYEGAAPPPPTEDDESGAEPEPKVVGYWEGDVTVAAGTPVSLTIKKSELKKRATE